MIIEGNFFKALGSRMYTLIELIVVLSTIVILSCMLIPALNKVRVEAKTITCTNNLKQIGTGILLYVSDNNGWMPFTWGNANYVAFISPYLGEKRSDYSPKPEELYFCPEIVTASESPCWDGSPEAARYPSNYASSYNHRSNNPRSGGWMNALSGPNRRYVNIKNSSVIISEMNFFTNSSNHHNATKLLYPAWVTTTPITNPYRPAFNHSNKANFLTTDGHVQLYLFTGDRLYDSEFIPY